MITWIAIGVLVIVGLFFLKVEHHTRKYKVLGMILIGLIIYLSIIGIFSSGQIDMTSPKGIVNGAYLYIGWIGQTASSLWDIGVDTTHIVGNAIKANVSEEERVR